MKTFGFGSFGRMGMRRRIVGFNEHIETIENIESTGTDESMGYKCLVFKFSYEDYHQQTSEFCKEEDEVLRDVHFAHKPVEWTPEFFRSAWWFGLGGDMPPLRTFWAIDPELLMCFYKQLVHETFMEHPNASGLTVERDHVYQHSSLLDGSTEAELLLGTLGELFTATDKAPFRHLRSIELRSVYFDAVFCSLENLCSFLVDPHCQIKVLSLVNCDLQPGAGYVLRDMLISNCSLTHFKPDCRFHSPEEKVELARGVAGSRSLQECFLMIISNTELRALADGLQVSEFREEQGGEEMPHYQNGAAETIELGTQAADSRHSSNFPEGRGGGEALPHPSDCAEQTTEQSTRVSDGLHSPEFPQGRGVGGGEAVAHPRNGATDGLHSPECPEERGADVVARPRNGAAEGLRFLAFPEVRGGEEVAHGRDRAAESIQRKIKPAKEDAAERRKGPIGQRAEAAKDAAAPAATVVGEVKGSGESQERSTQNSSLTWLLQRSLYGFRVLLRQVRAHRETHHDGGLADGGPRYVVKEQETGSGGVLPRKRVREIGEPRVEAAEDKTMAEDIAMTEMKVSTNTALAETAVIDTVMEETAVALPETLAQDVAVAEGGQVGGGEGCEEGSEGVPSNRVRQMGETAWAEGGEVGVEGCEGGEPSNRVGQTEEPREEAKLAATTAADHIAMAEIIVKKTGVIDMVMEETTGAETVVRETAVVETAVPGGGVVRGDEGLGAVAKTAVPGMTTTAETTAAERATTGAEVGGGEEEGAEREAQWADSGAQLGGAMTQRDALSTERFEACSLSSRVLRCAEQSTGLRKLFLRIGFLLIDEYGGVAESLSGLLRTNNSLRALTISWMDRGAISVENTFKIVEGLRENRRLEMLCFRGLPILPSHVADTPLRTQLQSILSQNQTLRSLTGLYGLESDKAVIRLLRGRPWP
ncbi:hypothetical protein CBR_g38760 [Chara braunii]|uniref:Uncharacterized protein n=1 Tax=Chara braunii TaxID=69332 RepID=A0A388LQ69_CHABU|nr:hypothetical protein CBR_g38760 [Chara braunii]|eukprot:GBG84476.1 hypothetical protein CBR_g38760 [Chara braunii]